MIKDIINILSSTNIVEGSIFVLNFGQSSVGGRGDINDISDSNLLNAFPNTLGVDESLNIAQAQSQINLFEVGDEGKFGTSLTFINSLLSNYGKIGYCLHGVGGSNISGWGYTTANRLQLLSGDLSDDNGKVSFDGTSLYSDKYEIGEYLRFDLELDGFYKVLNKVGNVFTIDLDWDNSYLTAEPRLIYGNLRQVAFKKLQTLVNHYITNNFSIDTWVFDWNQGEADCKNSRSTNWDERLDDLITDINLLLKTIYNDSIDRINIVITKQPSDILTVTDPSTYNKVSDQRTNVIEWQNNSVTGITKLVIDDNDYYQPNNYFFDGIHLNAEGNEKAGVDRYNLI